MLFVALAATSCAALLGNQDAEETDEPFDARRIAWSFVVERHHELDRPQKGGEKSALRTTLAELYAVVGDHREKRDERARSQVCAKAWSSLARQAKSARELAEALQIAQGYLGAECGEAFARKAIPILDRSTKKSASADLMYYAARFWHGEVLLEAGMTSKALTEYRYVLGEIESPLYPLALLRTAHCHWDAGDVDQARESMQYVLDWIGEKTQPTWVLGLKGRVAADLADFSE
jgi:tetratricopeptide (TPR) repeat protein